MPRRSSSIFSTSSSASSATSVSITSEKSIHRRPSTSRANKIANFFSTTPKSKTSDSVPTTASASLIAAAGGPQYPSANSPQISSAVTPLPTISLSTATAGQSHDAMSTTTTLFCPPSLAEMRKTERAYAQFGPLCSPSHLYVSQNGDEDFPEPVTDEPPYYFLITTYISYLILIIFGHVRDFFGKRFKAENYAHLTGQDGYAPLNEDFDNFYVRRLKMRINDCFARPVRGVPGRYINLLNRESEDHNLHFRFTGSSTETLNLSSYNYLGFAQSEGRCADDVEEAVKKMGVSFAGTRADAGTSELHVQVEEMIARFVGKESAIVTSMGFGTNATTFPALVGKGCLVISDELNHASIRFGVRLSGAVIETFKHNNMTDLERVLREVISQGQPRTHRPWRRILVAVEGLYSMEGTMCNLPGLVALRSRYKFNLFVDEAHSIGALGPRGRGVCDYFGIDPSEVDILMGTLTKSFGANGGYVAADKDIIDKLRVSNAGPILSESPSPSNLMQILSALRIINGELNPGQGEERLQRLAFNSRYLRLGLKRLGFIVYGHDDSPIIPMLLYNPAKMPAFSHEMLRRKIAVVVVGYPATPLIASRARFCVSAAHNKDDLDRLLAACDEVGDVLQLKFSSGIGGGLHCASHSLRAIIHGSKQSVGSVDLSSYRQHSRAAIADREAPRWSLDDVLQHGVYDVQHSLR